MAKTPQAQSSRELDFWLAAMLSSIANLTTGLAMLFQLNLLIHLIFFVNFEPDPIAILIVLTVNILLAVWLSTVRRPAAAAGILVGLVAAVAVFLAILIYLLRGYLGGV